MISPVSSSQSGQVDPVQSSSPKTEQQSKAVTSLPSDTVSLKSTGDVDNGGNRQ